MSNTAQQTPNLKGHIFTWIASVTAACIIGIVWIYTHPVQNFVTVNISSLFNESAHAFVQSKDESTLQQAEIQAQKIDQALQQLADTCNCLVMNSAAIAKRPAKEQGKIATRDMTDWIKAYISREN